MLPEELAVAREGVCFRARGPARPLDGSRPRSRARRTFLYGEVLLFVAIAVAIVTIYATFAAPSLPAATLPPSPPSKLNFEVQYSTLYRRAYSTYCYTV